MVKDNAPPLHSPHDDVFTTGATMGERAKVLKAAGQNRFGGVVVARD